MPVLGVQSGLRLKPVAEEPIALMLIRTDIDLAG